MSDRHEALAREMVRAIYQQEPQEHEVHEIASWFRAVEAEALERAATLTEGQWSPYGNALSDEYTLRHALAAAIRALATKEE